MEMERRKSQECSVGSWRCDLDSSRRPARGERDVPAASHERGVPAASQATAHVRRTCEASALDVKVENDVEGVVKQELIEEEYADTWNIIKAEPDFMEAYSSGLVKNEMDEKVVKEELELGPVLLQSRTIPSVDSSRLKSVRVEVQADLADPRPSTDCVGGAASGQLYTPMSVLSEPASGRDAGEYCYEGGPGVLSDTNIKLNLSETKDVLQKVLRHQFCGSLNSRDCSTGTQEFTEKPYKCNEYITANKTNLIKNINRHLNIKQFKCRKCEFSTSRMDSLKKHMLIHANKKPYKCKLCEYSPSQLGALKQHMYTHTGEKPYKCKQCEYSASELGNLKRHMYIHTGEKPYKCERCEYSTSQLSALERHMYTHTGEKPYKCKQCEYSASVLGNLKRHMHTHTSEKPFKCEQCEYRASRLCLLKRHMHTHTGEKPYKCNKCEYRTSDVGHIKRHMHTHTGENT